uniref:Tetraspanin n=1 Tax=Macrostomum lignano TaxID=282301 RepID=A0A1I8F4M2_9PLAT
MGCSTSLAKMILFIFNVAFFIFGIASLGLGIWVAVNKNDLFRFINLVDSQRSGDRGWLRSDWPGTVHPLLVGFCGCCGAMKESKCLLMIYAGLVGLVLVLEITAAIMAAVFQSHVRNSAEAACSACRTVRMLRRARTIGDIANSSSWTASNRTFAAGKELKVPLTAAAACAKTGKTILLEYVSQYSKPIIIICVAIGLFEILGILFACCLIKAIENDVSYAKQ